MVQQIVNEIVPVVVAAAVAVLVAIIKAVGDAAVSFIEKKKRHWRHRSARPPILSG